MSRVLLGLLILVLLTTMCGCTNTIPRESISTQLSVASPVPSATPTLFAPWPTPTATSAVEAESTVLPLAPPPQASAPTPGGGAVGVIASSTSVARPVDPSLGDLWIRPADGMAMVFVPGGTFRMGRSESDPDAALDERPQHTVTLDGFWIDQTEVTNAQFTAFLNQNGNRGQRGQKYIELGKGYVRIRQNGDMYETTSAAANLAVVMVTWFGADAYCRVVGGRLPTEAEWEYAARGAAGQLYPWGSDPPSCDLANFGNCSRAADAVGVRPKGASWCGAQDLAGNVWEWVGDWYGRYPGASQQNPTGPSAGFIRVIRGGGWHSTAQQLRTTFRLSDTAPGNGNG